MPGDESAADAFDLVVRGKDLKKSGEPETEIIVAVQDDTSKTRVAWKAQTFAKDTFELTFPKLLKKGATYRVALAGIATYSLFRVDAVTDTFVLEVDQAKAQAAASAWQEAYDIIDTKLALAPGTYEAALPAAGTSIKLIVGADGWLHTRRIDYGCATGCGRIEVYSDPTCGRSLVRGDTMTAGISVGKTSASMTGSVAVEGAGLRIKGKMASGTCCSNTIDVLATRTGAAVEGCK